MLPAMIGVLAFCLESERERVGAQSFRVWTDPCKEAASEEAADSRMCVRVAFTVSSANW
jgi:hypothetical protein